MQWRGVTVLAAIYVCSLGALLRAEEPAKPTKSAAAPIDGTMTIGGKAYKLANIVVYECKIFDDIYTNVLVSDKAIPMDKLKEALAKGKGSDDSFMLWQPNLKISFNKEGKASFMNAWADNNSISVSGGGLEGQINIEKGFVTGDAKLAKKKDDDSKLNATFDIRFQTALLPLPAEAKSVAKVEPKESPDEDDDDDDDQPKKAKAKKADFGPGFNVHDFPFPSDAKNIAYKELVEMFDFESPAEYKTVAKDLVQKLQAQGWKSDGSDLFGVSCILKRTMGPSKLTIFVKPAEKGNAAKGSVVNIHSEGLSWEEKPAK